MLNAERAGMVLVDRDVVENLIAGWDEGLWGPETQDAGIPDLITGLIASLRSALATPAPADASRLEKAVVDLGELVAGLKAAYVCCEPSDTPHMKALYHQSEALQWTLRAALSAQPQPKAEEGEG